MEVGGLSGTVCGGCRRARCQASPPTVARYCGPACQRGDWAWHGGYCGWSSLPPSPPPCRKVQERRAAAVDGRWLAMHDVVD